MKTYPHVPVMTMRAGNGMKVWGNEVTLSRLWVDLTQLAPPPYDALYVVNCDGWDGYPSHKADLKYHDHDAQGYATATVTAAQMVVTFNKVKPLNADGTAPDAPLLKRTRITAAAGSLVPVIADNVRAASGHDVAKDVHVEAAFRYSFTARQWDTRTVGRRIPGK